MTTPDPVTAVHILNVTVSFSCADSPKITGVNVGILASTRHEGYIHNATAGYIQKTVCRHKNTFHSIKVVSIRSPKISPFFFSKWTDSELRVTTSPSCHIAKAELHRHSFWLNLIAPTCSLQSQLQFSSHPIPSDQSLRPSPTIASSHRL